jgi:hypothetical protein
MTKDKYLIRKTVQPPDWLQKAWAGAKLRGVDGRDINAEIAAHRHEKESAGRGAK